MWGNPGCPGHPDVERGVDEILQRAVESEARVETDRVVRYRAKYRTEKWLSDNQTLGRALCVLVIPLLIIECLLVDPRGFFVGP